MNLYTRPKGGRCSKRRTVVYDVAGARLRSNQPTSASGVAQGRRELGQQRPVAARAEGLDPAAAVGVARQHVDVQVLDVLPRRRGHGSTRR